MSCAWRRAPRFSRRADCSCGLSAFILHLAPQSSAAMQDDTASAPATRCSISVRQGGKRVALMELDPSTTLRECLQQLPADRRRAGARRRRVARTLLRDLGSTWSAAVPFRPDQINETLQSLGWFPSGALGDAPLAERPTATPCRPRPLRPPWPRDTTPPTLTGNSISGKIRTSQADAAEDAKRDAAWRAHRLIRSAPRRRRSATRRRPI